MEEQEMFFNENVARRFAKSEENEKNIRVCQTIEKIIIKFLEGKKNIHGANLFGGADTGRYKILFDFLSKEKGKLDWVDYSKIMLKLAKESLKNNSEIVNFVEKDYLKYLKEIDDDSLDFVMIKYSLDYIKNFKEFFSFLYKKMKKDSFFISTVTVSSDILKSNSTNARYFYRGKPIPFGESVKLKEGDSFGIGFFKESGNPNSGLIEGAFTTKYYFSVDTIKSLAQKQGFEVFFGDWRNLLKENSDFEMKILVLRKVNK